METITYREFEEIYIPVEDNLSLRIYEKNADLQNLIDSKEKYMWSFFDFTNPERRYLKNGVYTEEDVSFYILSVNEHNNQKGSITVNLWPEE